MGIAKSGSRVSVRAVSGKATARSQAPQHNCSVWQRVSLQDIPSRLRTCTLISQLLPTPTDPDMKQRWIGTHGDAESSDAHRGSVSRRTIDVGAGAPPSRGSMLPAAAPLSRLTIACYSVGHVLNDACASCWFSYLLLYLVNVQELSGVQAGIVLFSGQLFDAAATPVVGLLSDRSRGLPALGLGRRKLWNAIGVAIVVVCFFFVFGFCLPCNVAPPGTVVSAVLKTASFAVFASLFNVGWAAVQVSHMALVPELSALEDERVLLNSMRYGATILANLLVFSTMWVVLRERKGTGTGGGGSGDDVANSAVASDYAMLTYVVLGVGGAMSLIFLIGTPEPPLRPVNGGGGLVAYSKLGEHVDEGDNPDDNDVDATVVVNNPHGVTHQASGTDQQQRADEMHGVGREDVAPVRGATLYNEEGGESVPSSSSMGCLGTANPDEARPTHMRPRDWLRLPSFWRTAGVYMATRLAVNVSQVYLSFYVTETLELASAAIAIVPLLVYLSSLGATFAMKRISGTLGRYWSLALGGVLFNIGCVAMFLLTPGTAMAVYGAVPLLGIGSAITTVIAVSMEADLVGANTESGAFVYGIMSLTDKLSNGIVIIAIQAVGDALECECGRPTYIRYVNAIIPLAAMTLALVIGWTMRFPDALRGSPAFQEWAASSFRSGRSNRNDGRDSDGDDLQAALMEPRAASV